MNCTEIKENLSCYVDGAMAMDQALRMRRHLEGCPSCAAEAEQLESLRSLLRAHGRIEPPPGLAQNVKLRLSQRSQLTVWDRLGVRIENLLGPVAIPATAGLLATILTFGVMIHTFFTRAVLIDDVPVSLMTPPRLRAVPPITFNTSEEGLVVQTDVDNQGRIVDYRVLNGTRDPQQLSELRHMLVFTQFAPATLFGVPTSGRTVINFRRISVKG